MTICINLHVRNIDLLTCRTSPSKKYQFTDVLKRIKVLDCYISDISWCISAKDLKNSKNCKSSGLSCATATVVTSNCESLMTKKKVYYWLYISVNFLKINAVKRTTRRTMNVWGG